MSRALQAILFIFSLTINTLHSSTLLIEPVSENFIASPDRRAHYLLERNLKPDPESFAPRTDKKLPELTASEQFEVDLFLYLLAQEPVYLKNLKKADLKGQKLSRSAEKDLLDLYGYLKKNEVKKDIRLFRDICIIVRKNTLFDEEGTDISASANTLFLKKLLKDFSSTGGMHDKKILTFMVREVQRITNRGQNHSNKISGADYQFMLSILNHRRKKQFSPREKLAIVHIYLDKFEAENKDALQESRAKYNRRKRGNKKYHNMTGQRFLPGKGSKKIPRR